MKVLILDLTHGGEVLAQTYAEKGNDVTAVDIYRNCPSSTKERLISANIRVTDETPEEKFDLAVSPIHCPERFLEGASFERRLTHHQAVGELAHFNYPIVEVTGAVAKTSSCQILAHIMHSTGKRVLLLTSSGLVSMGEKIEVLESKASIAPATILRLSKMKGDWDFGIFECSLGGTGLADIGIITNLHDTYPIAAGTRSSNEGKMQMVLAAKHRIVIAAEDRTIIDGYVPAGAEMTTFGRGGDVQVTVGKYLSLGQRAPSVLTIEGKDFPFTISGRYLAPSYLTGLNAAAALAFAAGNDPSDIARSLASFEGVPGRGDVQEQNGSYIVRERNPGVTARSIDWNLKMMEEYYGVRDLTLVVDPVNIKVCEKLDLNEIAKVVARRECVSTAYVIDPGVGMVTPEPMLRLNGPEEVPTSHKIVLWCTKEGYV